MARHDHGADTSPFRGTEAGSEIVRILHPVENEEERLLPLLFVLLEALAKPFLGEPGDAGGGAGVRIGTRLAGAVAGSFETTGFGHGGDRTATIRRKSPVVQGLDGFRWPLHR